MTSEEKKYLLPTEDLSVGKDYSAHDDDDEEIAKVIDEVPVCCSYRLGVIICCTLSLTITYAAQASLSSAMVCMIKDRDYDHHWPVTDNTTTNNTTTNNTTTNNTTSSLTNTTGSRKQDWLFTWDKSQQGLAISAFFMGYYVSQIPATVLAARFGPKRVMVVSLILVSVFQGLAVPAAYYGIGWLYADRVIVGIMDGFLYAPTFALAGRWSPIYETSLLFGIVGMGMELGNVLSYATSLLACEISVQAGWPFVFYILAGLGLIVAVLIMIIVSDSPFQSRYISRREVRVFASFIPKKQSGPGEELSPVPVKEILSSICVWAIVISQIGSDWLYYFFVTMEPTFLKDVIKLTDAEVNLLSGLPFLGIIPTIYLAGYLCDKLVTKGVISNTKIRKINDFICKIIPSAILIGLGFLPQESTASAFVLNLLGAMCMGFSYVSWMANPADLAPAYTGFIVGICEIGAIWVAIVVPIVSDDITLDKTREEWQLVFYITAGLQVFCFLFYAIFASGELQPWAVTTSKHAYEDLDHVDGDQSLLEGAIKSQSHSKVSFRNNQSKDDEDPRLIASLSLSLGDFRGTSSYEASMRRNQEKMKLDAGVASSTILVSGPAHRRTSLRAGQMGTESAIRQQIHYEGSGTDDVTSHPNGRPRYYISNGALIVSKPVPFVAGFGEMKFETERYIESNDDSWQNTATRSLPSNLLRSVLHGRGDLDISSEVSSPLTSGKFDDEVSAGPPRNIKSLATEIAEASSVHSLDEPIKNGGNAKPVTAGAKVTDALLESLKIHACRNKNVNEKDKALNKLQNLTKNGSEMNKNLDHMTSRNIKYLRQRNYLRYKRVPDQDRTQQPGTKDPQLNSGNTSSIMVPSEDFSDSNNIVGLKGKKGDSKRRMDGTEKEQEGSGHKDAKQIADRVKRFFFGGKSKSNPHLNLSKEEPFFFVTDDDVKETLITDAWATKSVDSHTRNRTATGNHRHNIKIEKNKKITEIMNKEDDEHTLFVHPQGTFKASKK